MSQRTHTLAGQWERWVLGRYWDDVEVPSCLRLSGSYVLAREFDLPSLSHGDRVFLLFQQVAADATIVVNDRVAGSIPGHMSHSLEITNLVRQQANRIEVRMRDLPISGDHIGLGECYGGIPGDICVRITSNHRMMDVRCHYTLTPDFDAAECSFDVDLSSGPSGLSLTSSSTLLLQLRYGPTVVTEEEVRLELRSGESAHRFRARIENPLLWSPRHPHRYQVSVTLRTGEATDDWTLYTGFRELRVDSSGWVWNGARLLLQGFCYYNLGYGRGYAITQQQQRDDLVAMKRSGANFVRLMDHPHPKAVVELADELGLVILPDLPAVAPLTMRALIHRDCNSPSVLGWLLRDRFPNPQGLASAKAICKEADPWQRPVSFLGSTTPVETKTLADHAGMDFYAHAFSSYDSKKFEDAANVFGNSKPVVAAEWGWEDAGSGQIFRERNFDHLLSALRSGKLAGHAFLSWNDQFRYRHTDWRTTAGVEATGVVADNRAFRDELYQRLAGLFQNLEEYPGSSSIGLPQPYRDQPDVLPLRLPVVFPSTAYIPVDLQPMVEAESSTRAWQRLETQTAGWWAWPSEGQWERTGSRQRFWSCHSVEIEGVPFQFPIVDGSARPLLLNEVCPVLQVPLIEKCSRIYLLGAVTFPSGYPLEGAYGDEVATAEILYQGQSIAQRSLRNGLEIAAANTIRIATRIEPIATQAPPALCFQRDPAREQYQILLLPLSCNGDADRLRLRWKRGPSIAFFAITTAA